MKHVTFIHKYDTVVKNRKLVSCNLFYQPSIIFKILIAASAICNSFCGNCNSLINS